MKKISRIVVCAIFLLLPKVSYADFSIAFKQGYVWFDEHKESIYADNTIYDNEPTLWGLYARKSVGSFFLRSDMEQIKTGDEFENKLNFAYEGVHLRETNLDFTLGFFPREWFYLGAGPGVTWNRFKILEFSSAPLSHSNDPELTWHILGGVEKEIYENSYAFLEAKKTFQRADILVSDAGEDSQILKENLSNFGIYAGIGYRF